MATYGTLLVLVTFSAFAATIGDSGRSLHAGVGGQTWALSGMSLGLAVALLTVGALADDYGRRRVLVSSAVGLAVTSGLGALAPSIGMLVAARVVQGIAGAGVVAASLASIGQAFPAGPRRTHATGVWAGRGGRRDRTRPARRRRTRGAARMAQQLLDGGGRSRGPRPRGGHDDAETESLR